MDLKIISPYTMKYGQFPDVLLGNAANGALYLDSTHYITKQGDESKQNAEDFAQKLKYWIETTCKAYSLSSDEVVSTDEVMGYIFIDECLAMEYECRLSLDFSIWHSELANNGSASLNELKMGSKRQSNCPVSQTFEEALLLAAGQARKISEDEHKVVFYEEFVENRNWFKTTRIADELEITARELNRFLLEEEIIRHEKNQWVVLAPYRALQSDIPYMYTRKNGKVYPFGAHKRWNQAGRDFILELWYKRNPKLQIFQSQ